MNPLAPYRTLIELVAGLLLVAALAFAWWHHGHVRYEAGIAAQRAAEARSLAIYTKARDAQLASAEASYHAEIAALSLRPVPLGPVRLCEYVPSRPDAGQAVRGPTPKSAPPRHVQPVPAGNHPVRPNVGPDISGLLEALGRRADEVSAQLRAVLKATP